MQPFPTGAFSTELDSDTRNGCFFSFFFFFLSANNFPFPHRQKKYIPFPKPVLLSALQHWGPSTSHDSAPPALGLAVRQGTATVTQRSWTFFLCRECGEVGA